MLNYILENCTYYHIFQSIWVISFSTLFIVFYFMSKYSYELSYYFGIAVITVFTVIYVLYIVYIIVLAGLKFYSDCFYFFYKLYQNDFNFNGTIFAFFKDFVRYFIDDMAQTDMRAAKTLFGDVAKKGFDQNSIEKIHNFVVGKNREDGEEENYKAYIYDKILNNGQFFTLKVACTYLGLENTDMLNEYVKAKLSIAKNGNDAYIKAFDKILLDLKKSKNNFSDKEGESFFKAFKELIDGLNEVSYANNEEFLKYNGELLRKLENKFNSSDLKDVDKNKLKEFITFIHCFKNTDVQIQSGLLDKNAVLLYVDLLKGNFSLAGISNEHNIDQVRLSKFYGLYYKNALPVFANQKMIEQGFNIAGDLYNFDEKLKLYLFEELKAKNPKVVDKDLNALIKVAHNSGNTGGALNNKDLFGGAIKQLSRVPEEQRGLTIYNRDVAGNSKVLDNLADKFSGLNRKALPVAKITLLGPDAEPLIIYTKNNI